MTFSVSVESCQGRFAATLVGAPGLRVVGNTRHEALAALKAEIAQRVQRGELFSLEIENVGVSHFAGKYADDPTLAQISAAVYQRRDAELQE